MNKILSITSEIEQENKNMKELSNKIDDCILRLNSENFKLNKAKPSTIESLIQIFTLGIYNPEKTYLKEKEIIAERINSIRQEKANYVQKRKVIDQLIINMKRSLSKACKEDNEIYKALVIKEDELIKLSNTSYINDFNRVRILNELKLLIQNQKDIFKYLGKELTNIKNFYDNSKQWINDKNNQFIKNEKINKKHFFNTIELNPLTEAQRNAVLVNENNNLILAGAGSGKTSVVVAKTIYLIKNSIVKPEEILILAFNKNAQEELAERFYSKNVNVDIRTFHSFGLNLIGQANGNKPDICKMAESTFQMTKFINDTIIKLSQNDNNFLKNFIKLLAYSKIPYQEETSFKNKGEYYEYQKNYDMQTLRHKVYDRSKLQADNLITLQSDTVKSFQELLIGNFFTLNSIDYIYEAQYKHNTASKDKRQYKPDFYLPTYDIYIEHFGIDRRGDTAPYINKNEYLQDMQWKREIHKKNNTKLIETYSYEHTENNLLDNLKEKLLKHDVQFRQLNQREMINILNSENKDSWFTKLYGIFLNHFKSNMCKREDIKRKISKDNRAKDFFIVFEKVYEEYKKYQKQNNCIDFDDMIVKAITAIDNSLYSHNYKHIFIDEFQDISTTRALLIQKLISLNNASITAVGDDWQSINRFAGSNIKVIQRFENFFGVSKTIALDYTFRFDNKVSYVASNFIQKNPNQLKKTINTIKKQVFNKYSILLYWTSEGTIKELNKIIQIIHKKEQNNKIKIMVLSRYRYIFEELKKEYLKKFENMEVIFLTVHGSKGNEADYVIVLNINNGKMGFPSKVEDDPILNYVVPEGDDFLDAEERRLFYVALTRTKKSVFLLSNYHERSEFIKELISDYSNEIYILNNPSTDITNCPDCYTGLLRKRIDSKGNSFYGCSNFPRCKFTENIKQCPQCKFEIYKNKKSNLAECTNSECTFSSKLCFKCNGFMIERIGKNGAFLGCSNFPVCKNTENILLK